MSKIKININGEIVEMEQEEISKAIETGEIEIKSESLIKKEEGQVIYSKDEFETFKANLANEEYKKGKGAGPEMMIKDGREKYGLEFEGKTLDNFAEAFKKKILEEAKVEPSKKIQSLESDLEKIRGNYSALETEFTAFKQNQTEKETRASKDAKLLSFIPDKGLKVDKDIALLALKNKSLIDLGFDDENKMYVSKSGDILKTDKTREYEDPKIVIENSLKELHLFAENGNGSGIKDEVSNPNGGSYDKFVKEMKNQSIEEGTIEFNTEMSKRISNKTLVL